jgi:hypothetical protein
MEQQKVDNSAKDVKITGLTTEIGCVSGLNEVMLKEINCMTKMESDFLGVQHSATPASLSNVEFAPTPAPAHHPGPGPTPAPRPRQYVPDCHNPLLGVCLAYLRCLRGLTLDGDDGDDLP